MVRLGDASSYNTLGCGGMERRKQKGIRDIKGALWGEREEAGFIGNFKGNLDEYNQGFLLPITAVSKFILNFAVTSAIAHLNLSKKTSISDDKSR